ncbi:MAG: hypothetical protein QHJ73_02970, partial [Armatimonadota bacterium]|nr:hypothetical protein [Armatimonadota bacterium]
MSFEWRTATPHSAGMNAAALEHLWDYLQERGTHTFLVVRRDQIVFERYSPDWNPRKPHYTASLAKALVGG